MEHDLPIIEIIFVLAMSRIYIDSTISEKKKPLNQQVQKICILL